MKRLTLPRIPWLFHVVRIAICRNLLSKTMLKRSLGLGANNVRCVFVLHGGLIVGTYSATVLSVHRCMTLEIIPPPLSLRISLAELLRAGDSREAAKHFREAAARARRRRLPGRDDDHGATAALARNLRMEGIAVARAGDPSSAESLLRGGLSEVQGGTDGKGGSGGSEEGEGMLLAALGGLFAQQG